MKVNDFNKKSTKPNKKASTQTLPPISDPLPQVDEYIEPVYGITDPEELKELYKNDRVKYLKLKNWD